MTLTPWIHDSNKKPFLKCFVYIRLFTFDGLHMGELFGLGIWLLQQIVCLWESRMTSNGHITYRWSTGRISVFLTDVFSMKLFKNCLLILNRTFYTPLTPTQAGLIDEIAQWLCKGIQQTIHSQPYLPIPCSAVFTWKRRQEAGCPQAFCHGHNTEISLGRIVASHPI